MNSVLTAIAAVEFQKFYQNVITSSNQNREDLKKTLALCENS